MFDFAINKRHANRFSLIVKRMAALTPTLLLSLLFTSCMTDGNHMDDNIAGKSDTYINLNVSTPTAQARANSSTNSNASLGQDEISPSPEEEEKIYSIRVWAFKTGSTKDATPRPLRRTCRQGMGRPGIPGPTRPLHPGVLRA